MRLESSREFEENGVIFIEEIYTDGEKETTLRHKKDDALPKQPQPTPALSETEQAVLDTAVDVEYLVCLKDMDL